MTPDYIDSLADDADPQQLWRLSGIDQMKLPPRMKRQLDAGVALRRHAHHLRELLALLPRGESLLITPLSPNGSAIKSVPTPPEHERLRGSPRSALKTAQAMAHEVARQNDRPIDMVLYCPKCHEQHIDKPGMNSEFDDHAWDNPPHRSHICHYCGHIWRPADVPTNGVDAVRTAGRNDSPIAKRFAP